MVRKYYRPVAYFTSCYFRGGKVADNTQTKRIHLGKMSVFTYHLFILPLAFEGEHLVNCMAIYSNHGAILKISLSCFECFPCTGINFGTKLHCKHDSIMVFFIFDKTMNLSIVSHHTQHLRLGHGYSCVLPSHYEGMW